MNSQECKILLNRLEDLQKENLQMKNELEKPADRNLAELLICQSKLARYIIDKPERVLTQDKYSNIQSIFEDKLYLGQYSDFMSEYIKKRFSIISSQCDAGFSTRLYRTLVYSLNSRFISKYFKKAFQIYNTGVITNCIDYVARCKVWNKSKADIFILLSKKLWKINKNDSSKMAFQALLYSPEDYRFKFYLYRLAKIGNIGLAQVIYDYFCKNIILSDDETKKLDKIIQDAKKERKEMANAIFNEIIK